MTRSESEDDYPAIDHELAETIWPSLLATRRLSDEEFQALVAGSGSIWSSDLRRGGSVEMAERSLAIPSADSALPTLVLKPASGSGPFPCIYHVANGGKMLQGAAANLTDLEPQWVAELGVALVSVSPRVGPEHQHPAQVRDAFAGLQWVLESAAELDLDPTRIILYGKSGGGGIAASTALYARDHSGPPLAAQLLICPMIDDRLGHASSHYDVPPWTSANNRVGWSAILGDAAGGPAVSPYAAAARATDLIGLPPTYLEAGSSEVFRDETLDYASRLAAAGIPVEVHSWAGGFHSFEIFAPDTEISRACMSARTSYLRRTLRALEA